ncbi:MAG: DUF2071 domain-containing protein [Parafilimonas sp.]|nr:DUF2071 domain-containing protein [Parafilimonas sp.]
MAKTFLSAAWRNLIMANYVIDPSLLQKYLPCKTELDAFNNEHYVSLVAFLFQHVKVRGVAFPFHTNFEEVNLRFYVRYKEDNKWKRGVVFMKEIVPRRMISFVANTLYGEKYATHKMKHAWFENETELFVNYEWKVDANWNHLSCVTERNPEPIIENSAEEFITEHYWGYTFINDTCTGVYQVQHPKWRIHKVKSYDIVCDTAKLYGNDFVSTLNQKPKSVFLAEGSDIKVLKGTKIYSEL